MGTSVGTAPPRRAAPIGQLDSAPCFYWPARRCSLSLLASAAPGLRRDWPLAPPLPPVTAGTAPRAAVGRSGDAVTSAPGGGAIGGRGVTRDVARAAPGRERGPSERPRREGRAAGAGSADGQVSGDRDRGQLPGGPSAVTLPSALPRRIPSFVSSSGLLLTRETWSSWSASVGRQRRW